MEHEHLGYQRMMQVLESGRVCRVAAVLNGAPYLLPMCYSLQTDGRTPVVELHAYHDGDLLAAMEQCPQVTLEFERSARGGSVETVLLRGTAQVELPCSCQQDNWNYPSCPGRAAPSEPWADNGRVRFDGPNDGWPADRRTRQANQQNDCAACRQCRQQNSCPGGSCSLYGGVDCEDRYDRCGQASGRPQAPAYATICVRASELTGRCYPACVTRCRQDDLR